MHFIRYLSSIAIWCMVAVASVGVNAQSSTVRVMTFNILQGGGEAKNVGFDNALFGGSRMDELAAVIRLARADVVGIQEDAETDALLTALGDDWKRIGSVYSRFPVTEVDRRPFLNTAEVRLPGNKRLQIVNCHWFPPRNGYGPDLAQSEWKDAASRHDVDGLARRIIERCAVPKGPRGYDATIDRLRSALRTGAPVVLTGDFNEPSHLDWTEAYARRGVDRWVKNPTGIALRPAVAWPGSQAIAQIGFADTYRTVHSDEVARPGNTWTPEYRKNVPGRRPYDDQCLVRIDMVYHGGPGIRPISAEVVGENAAAADLVFDGRWPSDHRAVVVEFKVD